MDKKTENENLRSVSFYRASEDQKGKMPDDRLYRPYKEAATATIAEITKALTPLYDLVLLHDPFDGCLLLNLQPNIEQRVTKLPCRLHQKNG